MTPQELRPGNSSSSLIIAWIEGDPYINLWGNYLETEENNSASNAGGLRMVVDSIRKCIQLNEELRGDALKRNAPNPGVLS